MLFQIFEGASKSLVNSLTFAFAFAQMGLWMDLLAAFTFTFTFAFAFAFAFAFGHCINTLFQFLSYSLYSAAPLGDPAASTMTL